ncbi:uncharacterized protein AAEQ78_016841 isoform 1-T1 [Lycaon pictus]
MCSLYPVIPNPVVMYVLGNLVALQFQKWHNGKLSGHLGFSLSVFNYVTFGSTLTIGTFLRGINSCKMYPAPEKFLECQQETNAKFSIARLPQFPARQEGIKPRKVGCQSLLNRDHNRGPDGVENRGLKSEADTSEY